MQVSKPQDLLDIIQKQFDTNIIRQVPYENEEYHKHVKEQAARVFGTENFQLGIDQLIKSFWEDIEYLHEDDKKLVKENIAIGNILYNSVRARIIKSHGFYAIVINYGFYMYLNKYLKLLQASNNIQDVEYCNRIGKNEYSKEIFDTYRKELTETYIKSKSVLGTMLTMSNNTLRSFQLYFIELFTICHEIGHFMNGDLESNATAEFNGQKDQIIIDDKSHDQEYNADLRAFDLMITIFKNKKSSGKTNFPVELSLTCLIMMFDIFSEISSGESESHPRPLDRLGNIVCNFYGEDAADFILQTYREPGFATKNTESFLELSRRIHKYF